MPAAMPRSPRPLLAVIALSLLVASSATARPGSLVKHTVSGSGTFEQGRGLRAEVNRATFHPIDQHFALSVYGRMGWVITGQWERDGDEVILRVANMNNTPARGSGELKLDGRGNVDSVKVSGSTSGGAYRVRFKAGAPAPGTPPSVRLGPGSDPQPGTAVLKPFATEEFDRSRRGRGALTFSGAEPITLTAAEVQISPGGRVSVRATGGGSTYRFEGTAGSSGARDALDLVLHSSEGSGVVTGSAEMDGSGRAVERLQLQGWLGSRPFQLNFRAGR
jgi:hypothetical protein